MLATPSARAGNLAAGGVKAQVHLTLRDPYEWHPAEARASQCVHQAAENLKKKGAKNYFEVGDAQIELEIDPRLVPLP